VRDFDLVIDRPLDERAGEWTGAAASFELSIAGRSALTVTPSADRDEHGERSASHPAAERPERYSITGTMFDLRTGAPVERSYPDVWIYPVPELPAAGFHEDSLIDAEDRPGQACRSEAAQLVLDVVGGPESDDLERPAAWSVSGDGDNLCDRTSRVEARRCVGIGGVIDAVEGD